MENAELWWFLFFADLDECILGIHNCGTEQLCINTPGSFQCSPTQTCPAGFIEDAGSCTGELGIHIKINLALDQRWEVCIWGGLTLNLVTFFVLDVNECVAHSSPCLPGETCVNTGGSFLCRKNTVTCGRGYHLSQDGTRCDGTLLPESFFFIFLVFLCVCEISPMATDVNECQTDNVCGDHACFNLVGTYRCECRKGFLFNDGTKLCEGAWGIF